MTTSSDDGSEESESNVKVFNVRGKTLDITDRIPVRLGSDATGRLAAKVMETVIKYDEGKPHIWFAALMVTSYALQTLLRDGHKVSEETLREIFAQAMDLSESMRIDIKLKDQPITPTPEPPKTSA
jgi:hypothetical protein